MKNCKIEYVVLLCIVSIFIVENVILFFQINSVQTTPIERTSIREMLQHEPTESRIEIISMIESFELNGEQLSPCYIYSINRKSGEVKGDSLSILKLLGKYTILLRFSQYSCNTCIQEIIENICETFVGDSGKCKILILTDKFTQYFLSYLETVDKENAFGIYKIHQQSIVKGDNEFMPYIALVDSQGHILSALSISSQNSVYVKYFNQMCKKKINR